MPYHRPYALKIELVRGCTRQCSFCSLPNMEWSDSPWQFMSESLFSAAIDELAEWLPQGIRVECEGRGEPSFHPKLIEYFRYARSRYANCQLLLTSNGDMVNKKHDGMAEWVEELFAAGLNIVLFDCYDKPRYEDFCSRFTQAKRFFEDRVHPYGYRGPKFQEIICMDSSPKNENIIRKYHNQGGTASIGKDGFGVGEFFPLSKMCVRPFREMVLWSDGAMPICCNDWVPKCVIGRFPDMSMKDYWEIYLDSPRRYLLENNRGAIEPCNVCNERAGFRVGLEMDWFDK